MPKLNKRELLGERQFRVAEIDEQARTVTLAFSSEEPYLRYYHFGEGEEVLDHNPQSVRLDRLTDGAAVLVNHDTGDQVGVVESATIDSDRKGRAVVRFSKSQRGEDIFQDVVDGIRKLVSVGYKIHGYDLQERKGQPDLVRVTDWEPYEISIVAVPADATVGVGRSNEEPDSDEPETSTEETKTENQSDIEDRTMPEENKVTDNKRDEFDANKEREKLRTEETKRRSNIESAAEKFMDVDGVKDVVDQALREGTSESEAYRMVLEKVGEHNGNVKNNLKEEVEVGISAKERSRFSMLRLMDAQANPNDRAAQERAAFELEYCAEAARKMGSDFKVRGSFIPAEIFANVRDLTAGTATDGAELVATDLLAGQYVDILRNNMVAMQAGVQMLPGLVGNIDIPRQTSATSAAWLASEGANAAESEPQFDQISGTPKDLAAYTEITRRLRQQSTPAAEMIVRNDLFTAIALELDSAVYYGAGSSGEPQGINGDTGVDDPTFSDGTAPTYLELKTQLTTMMRANAAANTAYIMSPEMYGTLITTPKQGSGVEGNFIIDPDRNLLFGRPVLVSTQLVANDFVMGDFSQIVMCEWGGVELNVDPYTKALSGTERYIIFKTVDLLNKRPTKFSFHDAA